MVELSVIIPVFNSEKYIEQCLKSIVKQSFKDIEILCVNDGSTDNTKNILENFQKTDKRIKVINKENTGYGHSLNLALNMAVGKYISIIESDDCIKENMFETLLKIIKNNQCDIVKANFYIKGKKIKKYNSKYFINSIKNIDNFPQMLLIQPSIWSSIYKKDFLSKNNIKFNETKGASFQDISFHFQTMFLAEKVFLVDMPLYYYRTNNLQSSINSCDKPFLIFDEFDKINEFLENKKINKELTEIKKIFEFKIALWNFNRIKNKYNNSFLDKFNDYIKNRNYKEVINGKNLDKKTKFYLFLFLKSKFLFKIVCTIRKAINKYVQSN